MRILFAASHPNLSNGYARVGYEITRFLGQDMHDVLYYAFQGEHTELSRPMHSRVHVHVGRSQDPFGVDQFVQVLKEWCPDVVIIYNDIIVISRFFNALSEAHDLRRTFKLIAYLDLVYEYEHPYLVQHVYAHADQVWVFADFWKRHLENDMHMDTTKTHTVHHGVWDLPSLPDKPNARVACGIRPDDFVVLNCNRNSYRKALDITVRSFLLFWKKQECAKHIKLHLHTQVFAQGSRHGYDIVSLVHVEALYVGVDPKAAAMQVITTSGRLADDDFLNVISACDVGINTCMGEGFGLCALEGIACERYQLVSAVGGHFDVFADLPECMVTPTALLNISNDIDAHGGFLRICDAADFAAKIDEVYTTRPQMHGTARIKERFGWKGIFSKISGLLSTLTSMQ